MNAKRFNDILACGETDRVEFKHYYNGVDCGAVKTICAFLNGPGGDMYLGIENNGVVRGVPNNYASEIVRNIQCAVGNPDIIYPAAYVSSDIFKYDGKTVIRIHAPQSSGVHLFKRVVYIRNGNADEKVTSHSKIFLMHIDKQRVFSESRVNQYIKAEHLRLDLLPRVRAMALSRRRGHPWGGMSDDELLEDASLIGIDHATGKKGYNLAAIMLLGHNEVIGSVLPVYRTDVVLRRDGGAKRFDERAVVATNLIESYDALMGHAGKHLYGKPNDGEEGVGNPGGLGGGAATGVDKAIAHDMLVNSLIHREFTSAYIAKFVIERDRVYTENANNCTGPVSHDSRGASHGRPISPDSRGASHGDLARQMTYDSSGTSHGDPISPDSRGTSPANPGDPVKPVLHDSCDADPGNPIIAAFFRNIGLAAETGSGVRNIYKYSRRYLGRDPQFICGDVFRAIVPLNSNANHI